MSDDVYDLLVLGAGPAGLTAGLYGHRSGLSVLMIGGDTPGGQVTLHYQVENYPGFPGGVTGAQLMMNCLKQVMDETGTMPVQESVTQVDFSEDIKSVRTSESPYRARSVIIATGTRPRRLSVPGEVQFEGKGVFYCATCDAPRLRSMERRRAVVAGAGDTAFHTALALLPHAESVTVVSRGSHVKAERVLVERFEQDTKAEVLVNRSIKEIVGETNVAGLALENLLTGETSEVAAETVFVGIGQTAVTGFLGESLSLDGDGFIVTDHLLGTSVDGVFAAGDVRDTPLRQILTSAADGALAAHCAARFIGMNFV